MKGTRSGPSWIGGLLGVVLIASGSYAQPKENISVKPNQPVNITISTAQPAPDVSLVLGSRQAVVTPLRKGLTHTGGGNIDVQQPSADTIVITMSGVAVAYGSPSAPGYASMAFDLNQCFEVSFDKPSVKAAKLSIEGRVTGLLRTHCKGGSVSQKGSVCLNPEFGEGISLPIPSHAAANGENVSVNDKEGPATMLVPAAGKFKVHQTFYIEACMARSLFPCKAPSVEFAPDPALDPLWISPREPFHGAAKKDLGFQVTIKVVPEEVPNGNGNGNGNGK